MATRKTAKSSGVFVALLRGVNVGGNNMISMKSLKASFEELGFTDVLTYINSGNIIFKTRESDARKLEVKIEKMLSKEYALDSKVVIRSFEEMETLVKSLPRSWDGNSGVRYYVMFLRHTIDSDKLIDDMPINTEMEEVVYRPGTLLWSAEVANLGKSKVAKLVSHKVYKDMTVRNLNTTKKLHALMQKL